MSVAALPRLAPSQPRYFVGHPAYDGSGLTKEQIARENATSSKLDAVRARYDLPARYKLSIWIEPKTVMGVPKQIGVVCPVAGCSRDRKRILLIAPNGLDYWADWL